MKKRLPRATVEALIVLTVLSIALAGAIAGISVWLATDSGTTEAAVTEAPATTAEAAETTTTAPGTEAATTAEAETTETTETAATETGATETAAAGSEGDAAAGAEVFASAGCGSCHTLAAAGSTGNVGPNLDDVKPSFDTVVQFVTNGSSPMPAFGNDGLLTPEQIQDVAAYVVESTSG